MAETSTCTKCGALTSSPIEVIESEHCFLLCVDCFFIDASPYLSTVEFAPLVHFDE